ncbi:MAG: metalloregulator ArsR/SmtB family transcription factor [Congregibacter sp.]
MNSPALTTVSQTAPTTVLAARGPSTFPSEDALAELCKASADRLRLRVLRLLSKDAMDVSELCEVLDVRQPALSHHLKLMSAAGLLSSQRDGNHIFYRRNDLNDDGALGALRRALFLAADALVLDAATQSRRDALQRQRETRSVDFLRTNVDRFREQQDLIAAPERYASAVESALNGLPAPSETQHADAGGTVAIEIGPGDGWLLPRLSAKFSRVIAVDNAPEMLDAARNTAATSELHNIEFLLGDTSHDRLGEIKADLVVINMVLHHTPEPGRTLSEAAAALKSTGRLLITELCEHSQGWARENCGDLWLGFAIEEIDAWAQDAGLKAVASSYLGQRNGFKLQVRQFAPADNNQ